MCNDTASGHQHAWTTVYCKELEFSCVFLKKFLRMVLLGAFFTCLHAVMSFSQAFTEQNVVLCLQAK